MRSEAVVFVIPDQTGKRVFMEERGSEQSQAGLHLYPGGHIELDDGGENDEETRLTALRRELAEEFGIEPRGVVVLPCNPPAVSTRGTLLHPFVITSYEGDLPEVVKDKGNPTVWEEVKNALVSPSESVRAITGALVQFLQIKNEL